MFRKPRQSTSEEEIDEIFRQVISDNQRKNAESLNPFSLAPSDTAEDLAQVSKELAELPSKESQTKSANETLIVVNYSERNVPLFLSKKRLP